MINDADISENQLLYSYGEKVCMIFEEIHTYLLSIADEELVFTYVCFSFHILYKVLILYCSLSALLNIFSINSQFSQQFAVSTTQV